MATLNQNDAVRVARLIGCGRAKARPAARKGLVLLDCGDRGVHALAADTLLSMAGAGLLKKDGDTVALSSAGLALLQRPRDAAILPEGMGAVVVATSPDGSGADVLIDLDESPLAQLARRRHSDGSGYLDAAEIRAGERLRSDYTRGQIMPRMGANWIASVSTGRRGGRGGVAELTDAALAARMRVEKAIAAVGPELSGVLLDVCCYLKGLERVEAERRWPARSAKLLLKSALGTLSRHYEPRRDTSRSILHWGADDFRPSLDADGSQA